MASLGLKIYYLRTREKRMSQGEVAAALGIRQATISYIENDVTAPQWALVLRLCQFFDVTPTFLADESRSVVPRITERWGLRDALVTLGMSIEITEQAVEQLADGKSLCTLEPGGRYFDAEAADLRRRHDTESEALRAIAALGGQRDEADRALERELNAERGKHKKRRR